MSGFFDTVDELLDNGGQSALNTAGLYGAVSNNHIFGGVLHGAQAAYHGAHALNDVLDGNYREGCSQGTEAIAHGLMMNPVIAKAGELATWGPDLLANGINYFGMGEGRRVVRATTTVASRHCPDRSATRSPMSLAWRTMAHSMRTTPTDERR